MEQRLPGEQNANNDSSSRPIYDVPQIEDIEAGINVFVFSLYRIDAREYRNYRQRSILVTLKSKSNVTQRLEELAKDIDQLEDHEESYQIEVLDNEDFINLDREQRPQDSAIVSVVSPLVIAKRSPQTGRVFYNDSFQHCPHTSAPLRHVIAAKHGGQ